MELINKIKYMNRRLKSKADKLTIQEYIKLRKSNYCEFLLEEDGMCIFKIDNINKLIYVYYMVTFKGKGINISNRLLKLYKDYKVICSVNKERTDLIKFYKFLGFNAIPKLETNNYITILKCTKSQNLTENEENAIIMIKDKLSKIIEQPFRVMFDMDDTLNTMDSLLFKELGFFDKYINPYETLTEEDLKIIDNKYLKPNTYNLPFDINKNLFNQLGELIGFENIIIYSHCLSQEIARYKYTKIKEELNDKVSIVFSFDEKKPPLDSDVIFEDNTKNLTLSNAYIKYGIKRFYNSLNWELNEALNNLISILWED